MLEKSVFLNVVIYFSMINGYVKRGMLEEVVIVMRKMEDYNIVLNCFIYGIVIDGLFKVGE